jgi:predicted nucleic-acid-binding Zn-ribbon protein
MKKSESDPEALTGDGSAYLCMSCMRKRRVFPCACPEEPGLTKEIEVLSITCPDCGQTSYNEHDIRERGCGNCSKPVDDDDQKFRALSNGCIVPWSPTSKRVHPENCLKNPSLPPLPASIHSGEILADLCRATIQATYIHAHVLETRVHEPPATRPGNIELLIRVNFPELRTPHNGPPDDIDRAEMHAHVVSVLWATLDKARPIGVEIKLQVEVTTDDRIPSMTTTAYDGDGIMRHMKKFEESLFDVEASTLRRVSQDAVTKRRRFIDEWDGFSKLVVARHRRFNTNTEPLSYAKLEAARRTMAHTVPAKPDTDTSPNPEHDPDTD